MSLAVQSSPDNTDVSEVDSTPLDLDDDLFDVQSELIPVAASWRSIGIALRLKCDVLDTIDTMCRGNLHACLNSVVIEWLKRNYNVKRFGEPTWQWLVEVVGHPAGGANTVLAREIATRHKAGDESSSHFTIPVRPSPNQQATAHEPSKAATLARENRQKITGKFAEFQTNVCNKLVEKGVNIEQFSLFVKNQFPPGNCIPPPPATVTDIFGAITHHGLWDYFHFSPLVQIAERFGDGDPEIRDWVKIYRQDLKAYSILTTVEQYIEVDLSTTESPPADIAKYNPHYYCRVEWKTNFTNHTLQYLHEVWDLFSSHYLVPDSPPTALIDRICKGCISVTWLIPSSLTKTLIKGVQNDTTFLQQHRIIRVTVGDKCVYDNESASTSVMAEQLQVKFEYRRVQLIKTKLLGTGSYGAVYKAICDDLPCAGKILHPTLFQFDEPGGILRRFKQECRFLNAMKHPNIVQYFGSYQDPEMQLPVLLMELMDENLTQFLERSHETLPYHTQVNLCHDIALALAYLHTNGIVHRDLSSNNVLLIAGSRAKVADFGMAKVFDISHTTMTPRSTTTPQTMCPGTIVYMSPEALDDPPVYTKKLDSFSFGVLDIQIITRLFPNPGHRTKKVRDPRSPTGETDMPVLEPERRKSHINLIDSNHPLLPLAIDCLSYKEKDRLSAQTLCHHLAALKEAPQYGDSVLQAQESSRAVPNHTVVRRNDDNKPQETSQYDSIQQAHESSGGKVDNKLTGKQLLLTILILALACITAFSSRLFAIIRFESIIHEFDPWFNYRSTHYMATNGYYSFLNWFDDRSWYPLGRIVGGAVHPGLMVTSCLIHYVLNILHITVHVRDVCVFLAPTFSGFTAVATFLLTREVWSSRAGLLAACFIAIAPGYTSRSVAGSYDYEGVAIFALLFTYFLWLKSVKKGSVFWATCASLSYFYMVSAWGGYVFIINLVPLHVFVLLLMGRYSNRIYVAYTTFYLLGLILSMQVPVVSFDPIRTNEHMAAAGVFALINSYNILKYLQRHLTEKQFRTLFFFVISTGGVCATTVTLTYVGYIAFLKGHMVAPGVFALLNAYAILRYLQFHLTEKQFQTVFSAAIISAVVVFVVMVGLTYLGYIAHWRGHMVAAGVFALINANNILKYLQFHLTEKQFRTLFFVDLIEAVFVVVVGLTHLGYIGFWKGRFYLLYDTNYAKVHIPIIASVSEHQPTVWASFLLDLHVLVCAFPAGLWFVMKYLTDERVFVVLYAISAVYFAGVMVRLMLTLTPIVCVLAAIAISHSMDNYMKPVFSLNKEGLQPTVVRADPTTRTTRSTNSTASKKVASSTNIGSIVIILPIIFMVLFAVHCTWVTSNAYSSPSVVLATSYSDGSRYIIDDFREAYFWLHQNTHDKARVMSWWDYGYQITGMANRTTLVDNNTWNNSHIALVGKAMSSTEDKAYKIMHMLGVDYVLVMFGGMIGYSGDDINKFLWMVRIAEGEYPQDIKESNYLTHEGEFRVDAAGSPTLLNSLMYKLAYHRFGEVQTSITGPLGFDRTRNVEIGNKNITLHHLEEAYTTEHWLVRIYRVKDLTNRGKVRNKVSVTGRKRLRWVNPSNQMCIKKLEPFVTQ